METYLQYKKVKVDTAMPKSFHNMRKHCVDWSSCPLPSTSFNNSNIEVVVHEVNGSGEFDYNDAENDDNDDIQFKTL